MIANDAAVARGTRAREGAERRRTREPRSAASGRAVVGIGGPRPEPVLDVEVRGVDRLRKAEHLEEGRGAATRRLLLVARSAHDAQACRAAHDFLATHAIHRPNFATKGRGAGHHIGIEDEIGRLVAIGAGVLKIRRSRRQGQRRVHAVHAHRVRDNEPFVALVQRPDERKPELRRIEVVIDAFAQHVVRLPAAARITEHPQARSVGILRLRAELHAIQNKPARPNGVGQRGGDGCELVAIEDVDARVCAGEERGVHREEKTARFDLVVLDLALRALHRALADVEHAVADDIALLLRGDPSHAKPSELRDRLESVIATRHATGQKACGRHGERDVAHLEPLDAIRALALVIDVHRVRRVELAQVVEVHIHMHAAGNRSGTAQRELRAAEKGIEGVVAGKRCTDDEAARAAIIPSSLLPCLETRADVNTQIGVGAEEAGFPDRVAHRWGFWHQHSARGIRGGWAQRIDTDGIDTRHRRAGHRFLRAKPRRPDERRKCDEEPENAHQIQGGGVQTDRGRLNAPPRGAEYWPAARCQALDLKFRVAGVEFTGCDVPYNPVPLLTFRAPPAFSAHA